MQPDTLTTAFAADVARDLRRPQKQLQSQYLYDALGSSLFDAICRLPWYRITRAEANLLTAHAGAIAAHVTSRARASVALVELGVGSGEKLATIVEAVADAAAATVHLIDISEAALDATAARLSGFPGVAIARHQGTYEEGLSRAAGAMADAARSLVLFLGSNIGNFDERAARQLVLAMRQAVRAGDLLLLGTDLVKPERDLIQAYDDPLGVTAAFNKNLLVRINRELGGNFDLSAFDHRAVWNAQHQRVEMHLVSREAQDVSIPGADLTVRFAAGESIWTESSYKYSRAAVSELGAVSGFSVSEQWLDPEAQFALTLFEAV